ncbi:MAG TPA: hypothetical protein VNJ53_09895, partial [Gaiellaceae bacterium]|nr:hypothetical protein [Gaiellaceae bacterium]
RRRSPDELDAILVGLVDRLAGRLRRAGRCCRTVVLRLRFADFSRATRSHTLAEPTDRTHTLLGVARGLLAAAAPAIAERGLSLVGLSLAELDDRAPGQLVLPLAAEREAALDAALDAVYERFGAEAVTRAVLLGRSRGVVMPLLPD